MTGAGMVGAENREKLFKRRLCAFLPAKRYSDKKKRHIKLAHGLAFGGAGATAADKLVREADNNGL